MNAIRFQVTIDGEQVIRLPKDVTLSPGVAEVIILQSEGVKPEQGLETPHLFDQLANVAEELGISSDAFPKDLAENHDHYAHGAPKGLDNE